MRLAYLLKLRNEHDLLQLRRAGQLVLNGELLRLLVGELGVGVRELLESARLAFLVEREHGRVVVGRAARQFQREETLICYAPPSGPHRLMIQSPP